MTDSPTTQWLQQAKRGDTRAWERLLAPLQGDLYRFLFRMVRDESTALDLVHDVVVVAIGRIETLASAEQFSAWLFGIAYRSALDFLRKRKRMIPLSQSDHLPEAGDIADHRAAALEWLVAEEDQQRLLDEIARLPVEHQAALHLYYYQEHSLRECAHILDRPIQTVWNWLEQARATLRLRLQ